AGLGGDTAASGRRGARDAATCVSVAAARTCTRAGGGLLRPRAATAAGAAACAGPAAPGTARGDAVACERAGGPCTDSGCSEWTSGGTAAVAARPRVATVAATLP